MAMPNASRSSTRRSSTRPSASSSLRLPLRIDSVAVPPFGGAGGGYGFKATEKKICWPGLLPFTRQAGGFSLPLPDRMHAQTDMMQAQLDARKALLPAAE